MKIETTTTLTFTVENEDLVGHILAAAQRDSRSADHIINVALRKYIDNRDLTAQGIGNDQV